MTFCNPKIWHPHTDMHVGKTPNAHKNKQKEVKVQLEKESAFTGKNFLNLMLKHTNGLCGILERLEDLRSSSFQSKIVCGNGVVCFSLTHGPFRLASSTP